VYVAAALDRTGTNLSTTVAEYNRLDTRARRPPARPLLPARLQLMELSGWVSPQMLTR